MANTFKQLQNKIKNCVECPSIVKSRKKPVIGYGDLSADILFVGLAPGRNGADISGVPFTRDQSGVLLQEALIKAGFSLEKDPRVEKPRLKNVFITNIVKCNPKDNNGNNRQPSINEIMNCLSYFEIEKSLIKPKIIIPLGKIAAEYVLNKKINNFLQFHNKPIEQNDVLYIPFIHPSYIIRGCYNKEKYIQEIISINGFRKQI
jgi:uracil-DNA glycosylase family 4